jgi:aminopeptidase C
LQVLSDFRSFFADKRNSKAVYRPRASASFVFAHAVTLVGYNNQEQYWVVKNSWGRKWADGGMFKVHSTKCMILYYLSCCKITLNSYVVLGPQDCNAGALSV